MGEPTGRNKPHCVDQKYCGGRDYCGYCGEFKKINDIVSKHTDEIIALPDVNSIGVASGENGLYIEIKVGAGYKGGLPTKIEGVPTIIFQEGMPKALR